MSPHFAQYLGLMPSGPPYTSTLGHLHYMIKLHSQSLRPHLHQTFWQITGIHILTECTLHGKPAHHNIIINPWKVLTKSYMNASHGMSCASLINKGCLTQSLLGMPLLWPCANCLSVFVPFTTSLQSWDSCFVPVDVLLKSNNSSAVLRARTWSQGGHAPLRILKTQNTHMMNISCLLPVSRQSGCYKQNNTHRLLFLPLK